MRLKVLLVDDEPLARQRLRELLAECVAPAADVVGEAGNAVQAMTALQHRPCDLVLLDIHMPGADGVSLARNIAGLQQPPAVVFVTAHAAHALQAFEVGAADYLTKPVRLERLQQSLQKVERTIGAIARAAVDSIDEVLLIHDRGRTERLPLSEVLYLKAELKYVTVRTASRNYVVDDSLGELEERYGHQFIRIHRNALIARRAVRALQKHIDPVEGEGWAVRLTGIDELLSVSRRQLSAVREALSAP